jgi:hypothetical protein
MICISPRSPSIPIPSKLSHVALITESKRGSNNGKDNTGYNEPFEFDLEIKAAIIVITDDKPKFPRIIIIMNEPKLIIFTSMVSKNNITTNKLITKDNVVLKINFPRKTDFGLEVSFNTNDVPRSSSATNTLESPLELEKNIIIHNKPA